jgi:hypothetical protein
MMKNNFTLNVIHQSSPYETTVRERMRDIVKQQERLSVESWDAIGYSMSAAQSGSMHGVSASPSQMIEAMEDVW